MELNHISEFIKLAEIGNYMDASDELFISQSTLSKHINAMEKELGVSLFDRTTRRVQLNQAGQIFLPYARKIVQLQQEYSNALRISAAQDSKITLASTSQMVQYSIVDALAQYKRTHPSDHLDIVTEHHKNLKPMLRQHKADFIWCGEPEEEVDEGAFVRIPFLSDPLVALFPYTHPLARRETVSLQELLGNSIVMQDNSSVEQQVFLEACQQQGLHFDVTSLPTGKLMIEYIRQHLGIVIMLRTPSLSLQDGDISIVEIRNSPLVHVGLIYLKGNRLSPAAKRFLAFIQEWMQEHS